MIDGPEATARRAFDRLPLSVRRRVQYRRHVGRSLSLRNPKTFTEKVNWRIVNDRRDLLAWTCDKLAMKDYAEQAGVRVPRLVWSGDNASNLIEEWPADAPHRWVLKPNFGSGAFHFGTGTPKQDEAQALMDHWSDQHRENSGEWAYGQARRIFLVEEDLSSETPLQDYKFFVFEGRVAMIYVTRASRKGSSLCFYSPGWQPFPATYNQRLIAPVSPAPARLSAMVEAASLLGHPFDFIRVDLYSVGDQAIFGELTPYPAGGLLRFDPPSFDLWLGQQWTLPPLS